MKVNRLSYTLKQQLNLTHLIPPAKRLTLSKLLSERKYVDERLQYRTITWNDIKNDFIEVLGISTYTVIGHLCRAEVQLVVPKMSLNRWLIIIIASSYVSIFRRRQIMVRLRWFIFTHIWSIRYRWSQGEVHCYLPLIQLISICLYQSDKTGYIIK